MIRGVGPVAAPNGSRAARALLLVVAAALWAAAVVELAYRTSPVVPLGLAAGLGFAGLAFARPLTALYASILLIPLNLVSVRMGDVRGLTPAEVMFVLTACGWALGRVVAGQLPLTRSPLTAPLALLVVAVVPGLAVAVDDAIVVKTLLMWSAFFLVYQLVVADGRRITVRRLLLALVASAGIVGAIAVVKSGGSGPQQLLAAGENATNRSVGAFADPNQLAGFAAMAFPAAVALAMYGRPATRLIAGVAAVPILAGLVLSLSRGGLLAVAGALLVMLGWRPFRRFVLVAALVVVSLTVVGADPLSRVPNASLVTARVSSVSYAAQGGDPRLLVWQRAPQIIEDHLPFGTGAGNFAYGTLRYGLVIPGNGEPFSHAHNVALTVAAELGVLGVVALLWIAVVLGRTLLVACRRSPDRALAFAVAAGLTSLALQGLVDYLLSANFIAATVAVLAACAVILARPAPAVRLPPDPAAAVAAWR